MEFGTLAVMVNLNLYTKDKKCNWQRLLLLLTPLLCLACNSQNKKSEPQALVVAAAANVQFALEEIKTSFEKETKQPVHLVIGSSGKLTAQIQQGAPYDVFISANMIYPEALYQDSLTIEKPKVYAYGSLVWWTLDRAFLPESRSNKLSSAIKKIAIANPRNAPYGEEAVRALEKLGLWKTAKPKTVYGESIAQTNQYILSGVVDLGITAKSIVVSPQWDDTGYWNEIANDLYQPIHQGIVLLRAGKKRQPKAGQLFYDFMGKATAQKILRKYGYQVPEG